MYTRDFQERKKFEHFFYSWASILATSMFLIIALFGVVNLWQKERAESAEIAILKQKIAETAADNQKSVQKLQSLGTDAGIEEEARGKFNLKKDGEEMVVFLDGSAEVREKIGFWADAGKSASGIWQNLKNWLGF